uniref:Protein phosphatase 1 regulatory subunit 15A n=1 Tax=Pelusios castaneus TaxID=367368 RepID=A0A8C8SU21_9SAUR
MLRVTYLQPGSLLDTVMGTARLLDLLGYWHPLPQAVMRKQRKKMRRQRKSKRRKSKRRQRKSKRRQRMRMRRQRRKGHRPACPRLEDRAVRYQVLPSALWKYWEDLEKGEAFVSGSEQLIDGPSTSEKLAPCLGEAENFREGPQPGAQSSSMFHDQEEGGNFREDRKCHRESTVAQLEMEKYLEEIGDCQKQPLEGLAWAWQDKEPEGVLKPCDEDAASCLPGGADPGCPITKNPLVLSLFYCPSEEKEEDEDWPSDEEGDDRGWVTSEAPINSSTDWNNLEGEPEDVAQHKENEALWGALCNGLDPLNLLRLAMAPTPQQYKEQELRVSFYLPLPASEAETVGDFWSPPKKPWPMKWGTPCRSRCCELGSQRARDPNKAEILDSECNRTAKKVRFCPVVTVHPLVVWSFASRAARRGPWEELARDRSRFHRRIEQLGAILAPCLEAGHRARAWRRIHGTAPELAEEVMPFPLHKGQGTQDMSLPLCYERMEDPGARDGRLG